MSFNERLLSKHKGLNIFWENNKNCYQNGSYKLLQDNLMEYLGYQKESLVFYIFDEHQELFKKKKYGSSEYELSETGYFSPFTTWTSSTQGFKTITIYCGSSNSKFHNKLGSGFEKKMFFVCPPSDIEFLKLNSDLFACAFVLDMIKNKKIKEINEKTIVPSLKKNAQKLIKYTGKNPRDLYDLVIEYQMDFEKYYSAKKQSSSNHLDEWMNGLDVSKQTKFIDNLECYFALKFSDQKPIFDGSFYDKGLMYQEYLGSIPIPLNFPIEKLLLQVYIEKSKIQPIYSLNDTKEQGVLLQKQCLLLESKQKSFSFELRNLEKQTSPSKLCYTVKEIYKFKEMNLKCNFEITQTTLIIPMDSNYPYIDYIIYIPDTKTLVFKQITMSTIQNHIQKCNFLLDQEDLYKYYYPVKEVMHLLFLKKYSIENDIVTEKKNEKGSFSLCECLIKFILNVEPIITIENEEFVVKDKNNNRIHLQIVYASGSSLEDNKWKYPSGCDHNKYKLLKNIQYYCKDELKKSGIQFEQ